MTAYNIHIRGLSEVLMNKLKQEAFHQGLSINSLVLNLLNESLGISQERKVKIHHDLDKLAGTWTKKDALEFAKHTRHFEKIDKDLWE